jgi:hypothetical protein
MSPPDQDILNRAAEWPQDRDLADLTPERLRSVAAAEGTDLATALLYDRIVKSPEHGPSIERLDSLGDDDECAVPPNTLLAIAPGAFYLEFPHTGADGQILRDEAARMGMRSELIPFHSFGPLAENARILTDWLAARPADETIILVSASKGGSDVKTALAGPSAGRAFRNVAVWISLSGLLGGTPLAGWVLNNRLRTLWFRLLLWWRRYDFGVIRELAYGPQTPLAGALRLPPHLRAIHVVGFPLERHLTNRLARRCYRRVRSLGPNDGAGIVLADAARLPGTVYPVWGADHYLRPAGSDLRDLARRLLLAARDIVTVTTPVPMAAH